MKQFTGYDRFYKQHMKQLREAKREREELKRAKRFEIDRKTFDEALEQLLDSYEYIMNNQ